MKSLLLSVILVFFGNLVLAQKEANIWYYGQQVGLNFNVLPPAPLSDGALFSSESSSVMADKRTGQLLFYTDGRKVWNQRHQIMPNGNGLLAAPGTSTQGSLIVPAPGNEVLYYVFTTAIPNYANFTTPGLFYSVVDMRLNQGLGDVVTATKNTSLLSEVSEKLTAVPHQNGLDYWIITHGWDNDLFYVYRLTSQGISAPQTYPSGTIHKDTTENSEAAGYLKASPNGKILACAVESSLMARPFELYDFDAATGQISHYRNLGNFKNQYGVSFSPDNSKLYLTLSGSVGAIPADSSMCQFNLSRPRSDGSFSYQYLRYQPVKGLNPWAGGANLEEEKIIPLAWALQLGPDGKLYSSSPYVINRPNAPGDSCLITSLEPVLNGKENRGFTFGLPNLIQKTFDNLPPTDGMVGEDCQFEQLVSVYPNPTSNKITIRLTEGCYTTFSYRVYNLVGQLLKTASVTSTSTIIDLATYPTGCYLIEVKSGQKQKVFKVLRV